MNGPAATAATPEPAAGGFVAAYRRLFSIHEIEQTKALQYVCMASLFVFFMTFYQWAHTDVVSIHSYEEGTHLCWPYFQSCGEYYFLESLPYGYSQNTFYVFLLMLITGVTFAIIRERWVLVHAGLGLMLAWEFAFLFLLNMGKRGNYDYYQVILTAILLLLPLKLRFLRITFVVLYFLAASIKIHEGWVLGTYWSSMRDGMPIFHEELIPLMTNTVIFMEMIGCWFLLSHNRLLQRGALLFFVIFHFYSGIIVWYRYPATILPYLFILFLPHQERFVAPRSLASIPGWALVAALFGLQAIPVFIEGDEKHSFEGIGYGLYMFDSNHQCVSTQETHFTDGEVRRSAREKGTARARCDPYYRLFRIWQECRLDPQIDRIHWRFYHSMNGGPFYEIVDEENACELEYSWYSHNPWIKLPEKDDPTVLGYPVKNVYY